MRKSLTWKLIGAFLLVAFAGFVVAVLVTRWLITREFNAVVTEQAGTGFVSAAANYYRANGTWNNIAENSLNPQTFLPTTGPPPGSNGSTGNDATSLPPPPLPSYAFVLADLKGIVLVSAGPYNTGDRVPPGELSRGIPIEVDGQVVGTALQTGSPAELSPREELYLTAAYRVLLYDVGIAALFALILGVVLSVFLTRPLRELTTVIRNMTPKTLGSQVKIRSRDEMGQLAAAFNQLSSDLAKSNQLRRQMTADIAHELRSPLQIVAGYIESMQDGILEPTPERLNVISAEVNHMNHLVADLRTLTLADSKMLTLNWQTVMLQILLKRVVSTYSNQAERSGIILEANYPNDIAAVRGDEERLMQVLGNIISNALRYTPVQGKIQLSAVQVDGTIRLQVQDTGQGISADDLPFVFERFYRASKARESQNGESGLGLAIAKSIVEAHNGTITAASPGIGAGATFEIILPVFNAKLII